jgi:hypothetical protein
MAIRMGRDWRFLLISDMQKAQRNVKVNEEIERQTIELLYIPTSMTNKLQLLDHRIFVSLKQRLWARVRTR